MNKNEPERHQAKPKRMPRPTFWPFFTAMGVAFILWGMLTTWILSVGGFLVLALSLFGWINEWSHE